MGDGYYGEMEVRRVRTTRMIDKWVWYAGVPTPLTPTKSVSDLLEERIIILLLEELR